MVRSSRLPSITGRRGTIGENEAARHLTKQGLRILLRNVRVGPGEIDLVCRHGNILVMVEVKSRQIGGWERPSEAVDQRKRRILLQSTDAYLQELGHPEINVRFDIVEVGLRGDQVVDIQWIPSAFDSKGR
ncbi:MAG: YraN family protein [Candidatus Methylacidiphilales bacterium]